MTVVFHQVVESLFLLFIIFVALLVVFASSTIVSVFSLVLVFLGVTGILLLLKAEFLAMVFLVVYVGAVSILFLFVVMMLNLKDLGLEHHLREPPFYTVGIIYFFILFFSVYYEFIDINLIDEDPLLYGYGWGPSTCGYPNVDSFNDSTGLYFENYGGVSSIPEDFFLFSGHEDESGSPYIDWVSKVSSLTSTEAFSRLLYTYYCPLFIIVSLVLLVAMIGSIVITLNHKKDVKRQRIFEQINRYTSRKYKILK